MEQLREEVGTKKDLVNYRLQTARADYSWLKNIVLHSLSYQRTKLL